MSDEVEKMSTEEDLTIKEEVPVLSKNEVEKQEEAKLKAKYPTANIGQSGHSAFLQKKLAKGTKYFDSGDYQMARQLNKVPPKTRLGPGPGITQALLSTGEVIPTPESVPLRKTSIIHTKYQSAVSGVHPSSPGN